MRDSRAPSFTQVLVRDTKKLLPKGPDFRRLSPWNLGKITRNMNKSWGRRSAEIPNYTAKELLKSRRSLFGQPSPMELHVARLMKYEIQWQHGKRRIRGTINTKDVSQALARLARRDELSLYQRAKLKVKLQTTLNTFERNGGNRFINKLTLDFKDSQRIYQWKNDYSRLSPLSLSILKEAKRQAQARSAKSVRLIYNPALDKHQARHEAELKALYEAGWAKHYGKDGSYDLLKESTFRWRLKQTDSAYGLTGSERWAARAAIEHRGIGQQLELSDAYEREFLHVQIRGDATKGIQPLKGGIAQGTKDRYERVANQIKDIPLESRPQYLAQRAQVVSRSTFWLEHAVVRRQLYFHEVTARNMGDVHLSKQFFELRRGVEAMKYRDLKRGSSTPRQNQNRRAVPEDTFELLLEEAKKRGDMELHDALVIAQATGLRPAELQRGIWSEKKDGLTEIQIQTAKKYDGKAEGEARYKAQRGIDRTIESDDPRLAEVMQRHHRYFKPKSNSDQLRSRLVELRRSVDDAEDISFYTFRHAYKSKLQDKGASRDEIKQAMGHRSEKSQDSYGSR